MIQYNYETEQSFTINNKIRANQKLTHWINDRKQQI